MGSGELSSRSGSLFGERSIHVQPTPSGLGVVTLTDIGQCPFDFRHAGYWRSPAPAWAKNVCDSLNVPAAAPQARELVSYEAAWMRERTIMKILLLLVLSMVAVTSESTAQDAQCVSERAAMVETIRAYARSDARALGQQGISERVLQAIGQTKRHLFIPERSCAIAYADMPIPIGLGQTISQPFIVALMTQLAEIAPDHVVLEVGTGSGYQAAILAQLARKVCTIEIIPQLAEAAAKALKDLAYDNVSVRLGDGYDGWPECGPFDAIIVTAALGQLPPPLIEQLKVGGRLIMPVGPAYTTQNLTVVEKTAPGTTTTRAVALVRFVPFTRSQN
jgi:protein-L-isoaspartate(D-aspartate) O-methyltransferase